MAEPLTKRQRAIAMALLNFGQDSGKIPPLDMDTARELIEQIDAAVELVSRETSTVDSDHPASFSEVAQGHFDQFRSKLNLVERVLLSVITRIIKLSDRRKRG